MKETPFGLKCVPIAGVYVLEIKLGTYIGL